MNGMKKTVREIISENPSEVTTDFLEDIDLCNVDRWYVGIVVNNNDPDQEGKCRIRVYGIFGDEIPDDDLPWALPEQTFIGSKMGNFIVPPQDAIVRVRFDNGDIYLPHYTSKVVDKSNLPSQRTEDYPDNMVFFETDEGDYLTFNRKQKSFKFHHNSGNEIIMENTGNYEYNHKSGASIKIDLAGNIEIQPSAAGTIKHKGTVDATDVNSLGPYCALPSCLYTGAPHRSNTTIGQIP